METATEGKPINENGAAWYLLGQTQCLTRATKGHMGLIDALNDMDEDDLEDILETDDSYDTPNNQGSKDSLLKRIANHASIHAPVGKWSKWPEKVSLGIRKLPAHDHRSWLAGQMIVRPTEVLLIWPFAFQTMNRRVSKFIESVEGNNKHIKELSHFDHSKDLLADPVFLLLDLILMYIDIEKRPNLPHLPSNKIKDVLREYAPKIEKSTSYPPAREALRKRLFPAGKDEFLIPDSDSFEITVYEKMETVDTWLEFGNGNLHLHVGWIPENKVSSNPRFDVWECGSDSGQR